MDIPKKECIFVNYSNHPSDKWDVEQISEASKYGRIVDIPFPNVPPLMDEDGIASMADEQVALILSYSPDAVMCQGEFTLSYSVINRLLEAGISVLAACSDRVKEEKDGMMISNYKFIRFREYK